MSDAPAATELSPIAVPLAGDKLCKRVYKISKKAAKAKFLRRGVKEVVKCIRKGEKGLCIIAGDISPIDVITHLPVLCEENDIPYIYVPSKAELGAAANTKRPTSCVLINITGDFDYKDKYDEIMASVRKLAPTFE